MSSTNKPPDKTRGFWQWVKNPWIRRRAEHDAADLEANLETFDPDQLSQEKIDQFVGDLIKKKLEWPMPRIFDRLGARAVPSLLRALDDSLYLQPYRGRYAPGLPLESLIRLLEPFAPAEMLGRLVELVTHKDAKIRRAVAGMFGHLAALDVWLTVSRDPDEDVQRYALWGIDSALTAKRVTPEFAVGALDRVIELVDHSGSDSDIVRAAAKVAARLDPARALTEFLNLKRFTANNPRLYYLLKAANEHDIQLPPDRVSLLLIELRPKADEYFGGCAIGYLLLQLARQKTDDARRWAEEVNSWSRPGSAGGKYISRAAADALALLNGINNPTSVVLRRLETVRDVDLLTAPQSAYYVAWILDAEVCNGGFAQYFVNSSGDTAGRAVSAFETIGSLGHAAIVRRAVALFGKQGPATDREERHDQLAKMSAKQDAEMNQLATEYYDVPEDVTVKLTNFANQHAEHFRDGV
ncbi:pf14300 domain protein : PBS lyase HEAT domain protein repeat-containing protein OS=Planctomyces limnophilus (strain ATCC 43296 / DSM 3776 / IFAM 1008 / 290) GN=Plim_2746 PE=4 SV=1: DUF4375 [Gemmata massiliana]|uniref:DNA mimic protein DMP19 C-terminal domain-containing protein n=1 Tax=Gemmata massiliana TaxID=1210884 RepID=A0A6P2D6A0_9BACT|nr:DMP19 family protein [Gemmata massiliana]VTR94950.1 pf14300 domain protein : PBS lyase HEAT domain protein repeat-containing protein OS=Planctomyces limnophilus (strain ATCC 43296 / DSM 3776 / IFAM 1008 / 290) GN=Plim_2746 PE=4 SV=1: DUF4375 [Gemmata massiliana]